MNNIYFLFLVFLFLSCNLKDDKKAVIVEKTKKETTKPTLLKIQQNENQLNAKKTDTLDIPIGKINGFELVYDCIGCRQTVSEGITIYYKKNNAKKVLLNLPLGDYYVDEVSTFKNKNDYFIYVGTTHTYGHSRGYLYYLNTLKMKTYEVKVEINKNSNASKQLDTLDVHKYFELTKDEKDNFGSGATYRSKTTYYTYYCTSGYYISKIGENKFSLISKNNLTCDREN